jgi:hypothetical protein
MFSNVLNHTLDQRRFVSAHSLKILMDQTNKYRRLNGLTSNVIKPQRSNKQISIFRTAIKQTALHFFETEIKQTDMTGKRESA